MFTINCDDEQLSVVCRKSVEPTGNPYIRYDPSGKFNRKHLNRSCNLAVLSLSSSSSKYLENTLVIQYA